MGSSLGVLNQIDQDTIYIVHGYCRQYHQETVSTHIPSSIIDIILIKAFNKILSFLLPFKKWMFPHRYQVIGNYAY